MADPESVLRAVREFDEIGRDQFLAKYGFRPARGYLLLVDGRRYDSKAVVGAAHGFEFPGEGPLKPDAFSGGVDGAAGKLRDLGFVVEGNDDEQSGAMSARVWVEKTIVKGRPDRSAGPLRVGAALWSPKVSKGGADVYRFMREVRPGDYVLHLTDNEAITRVSRVAARARDLESAPAGTPWSGDPLQVVDLIDSVELDPSLERQTFFADPWGAQMRRLLESGARNLFFNRQLELNQGAYLTPAPTELVEILNAAYRAKTGRTLIDLEELPADRSRERRAEYNATPNSGLDWLVSETMWAADDLRSLIEACQRTQVILAGPPGTGKTWVARAVATHLAGGDRDRIHVVQFHPSYGYEEFIEGLRPTWDAAKGGVQFRPVEGVVLRLADRVLESGQDHYLIIDEMNRANLPRVFGELLYLFEYRGVHDFIELQYGGFWEGLGRDSRFRLPPGLHFMATMNTADRSIRSIDSAMRRRFEIFFCRPDTTLLTKWYARSENSNSLPGLESGLEALNARLLAEFDEHHLVGHTFFMKQAMTPEVLRSVWVRQVQPLVGEFFFDRPSLASEFTLGEFWPSAV